MKRQDKRTIRKRLIAENDQLASLYVRLRDRKKRNGLCWFPWCENTISQAFHIVTRAKFNVRWDVERNLFGTCGRCNIRNEYEPGQYLIYYMKVFGQDTYEALVRDGHKIAKHSNEELEAIRDGLKAKLEKVCLPEVTQ